MNWWLMLGATAGGAGIAHGLNLSPIAGAGVGAIGYLLLSSGLVSGVRS